MVEPLLTSRDPYKILGVNQDDSKSVIKKAYHKLALKYHPDKNNDLDAEEKFKIITKAYTDITNPRNVSDMAEDFPDLSELFGHMFGTMFNFGGGTDLFMSKKGSSAKGYLNLSLEEIYEGGKFKVEYTFKNIKGMKQMDTNDMIPTEIQGAINMMGGGNSFQAVFMVPDEEIVTETTMVNLEPGFDTNNPLIVNLNDRDLIVFITEKPHSVFKRQGDDLIITLDLSLKESLTGFEHSITHLDSRTLDIQGSSIVNPYTIKRIPEEGMTESGCLVIKFEIRFPEVLDDSVKTELKKLL